MKKHLIGHHFGCNLVMHTDDNVSVILGGSVLRGTVEIGSLSLRKPYDFTNNNKGRVIASLKALANATPVSAKETVEDLETTAVTLNNLASLLGRHITKEDAKELLFKEYHKQSGCMGDFLASCKTGDVLGFSAANLTFEDMMHLYCYLMHEANGDNFYRENDADGEKGQRLNLLTGKSEPMEPNKVFVLHKVSSNEGVTDCCVIDVFKDKTEAEARLKLFRDKFVSGLDDDESLESLDKDCDTLTDQEDFFCYYKFDTNHHFQLEIVEGKI